MGQQSSKESQSSVVGSTVRAVSGATGAAAGAVKDTAGQISQSSCVYHCKNERAYVREFGAGRVESTLSFNAHFASLCEGACPIVN